MIFGLDYLGGAKYPDLILKEHPEGWAAGFFANCSGFGSAQKIVSDLAATGRCPLIRVHLVWDDGHKYGDQYLNELKKQTAIYTGIAQHFEGVDFELSPFCEHELKNPDKYLDFVNNLANGHCTVVNTPLPKGALSTKYKNEVHGSKANPKPGSFNFSWDGQSCVDTDVTAIKARLSKADVFFFWEARFSGKWEDNDTTPRPARKGYPDSNLIDSVIALRLDKGRTNLPPKWLYKSHSENKGKKDPRAEKPVMIAPIQTKQISIKARNGQVVGTMTYYGSYTDGRRRYYANDWGYLIADKAKRIQGDKLCEVWANGKKVGVINPAFRDGEFR